MSKKRTANAIVNEAIRTYEPVARYVGFSGGSDSLATVHWMMENVPDCVALHCNTGIGIERTREFVRDTCRDYGWPLVEVRAKEDCGQDYDELVRERGFPGPDMHKKMYARLKERCIEKVVRDSKTHRMDKVLIATGIRHDESRIRAGYAGREINRRGAQVWINPLYWWTGTDMHRYIKEQGLPKNPVSDTLGMSGECLCGAFAHKGEKELVRVIDPSVVDRIERLEAECLARGMTWGWEQRPPEGGYNPNQAVMDFEVEQPMCVGCGKKGAMG
jgi:3'-phosphoadenosine 5'-phosphosulfate sulfotransferase (PAPS reductase)/FAD synthetase